MATSALCGMGGTATSSNGAVEVIKFEVDQMVDAIDATSLSSNGWKEKVACLTGASGSYTCIGGVPVVGAGTATFTTPSSSIGGSIIVSQVTVDTPVDGIVSATATFVFTGTVTVT